MMHERRQDALVTLAELTKRVTELEAEVKRLGEATQRPQAMKPNPWIETAGMFGDDPAWEEINRLGRAYRESLRPKNVSAKKKQKKINSLTKTVRRGAV
jgi:hypothetical protein